MTLISGVLLFVAGMMFHKTWSSLLEFGALSSAMEKVTKEFLICLILIEYDVQFALESKRLILKEKGISDEEIEHYSMVHNRTYKLWKEKVIITLINNYPSMYRKNHLPFSNWDEAAQYIDGIIKQQKLAANK
jgi:hypothetical protein